MNLWRVVLKKYSILWNERQYLATKLLFRFTEWDFNFQFCIGYHMKHNFLEKQDIFNFSFVGAIASRSVTWHSLYFISILLTVSSMLLLYRKKGAMGIQFLEHYTKMKISFLNIVFAFFRSKVIHNKNSKINS